MRPDRIRQLQSLFFPIAETARAGTWQPAADVYRTRQGWLVKLDLAGVRPEDVQVSAQGSRLTVRGTRRDWSLQEGCCHYQMEIAYSHFERSLTLPCDLEHARVSAEHRHGMLLIEVQLEGAP
jgi:HSP20 family protein